MNNDAVYVPLPLTGKYYYMLGRPGIGFDMLVHGTEGSGKTTMLLQFAKYLAQNYDVLYVSAEEYGRPTLSKKLAELEINEATAPRLHLTGNLNKVLLHEYDFVFFDSLTHSNINLSLTQYQQLKAANPGTSLILVVQSTKDGSFRGSREWAHEVDCKLGINQGVCTTEKNRYYDNKLGDGTIGKVGTQIPVFD